MMRTQLPPGPASGSWTSVIRTQPAAPLLLPGSAAALQEVINQFAGAVIHLHVERLHLIGEVIEHPHCRDGHKQADGCGDQRFGNTASHCRQTRRLLVGDADERVQNAATVPNSPTNGAVEPMVASDPKPRFSSAWTIASARSRARLEASISSPGMSVDSLCARNSCKPAVTTLARCDFLLRSATRMASSILPSSSAPATAAANARDCLRAALKAR